jgi:hypothetical protein
MSGLRFNESDMNGSNEFPGSKVEKPIARAIIAIPDENAAECFGGEFVHVAVLQAEVEGATEYLNVKFLTSVRKEERVEIAAFLDGSARSQM